MLKRVLSVLMRSDASVVLKPRERAEDWTVEMKKDIWAVSKSMNLNQRL